MVESFFMMIRLVPCFLGLFFWATCCNAWVELVSAPYLYDKLDDLPNREMGLVLGSNMKGRNGINPYFQYRMEAAAELYFSGKVKKLIVSGDNHCVGYDETTDMCNYLVGLGVPESDIIKDYAGFRTLDSVIRAKKVFHCTSLIIVSQKFHNERAVFIARHHGIDAVAYNAQDVAAKGNFTHWREFGAKFGAVIDVFLLNRQPKFLALTY